MSQLIEQHGKYYKEVDVVMLPSNNSHIYIEGGCKTTIAFEHTSTRYVSRNNNGLHLYFLSDEEIKEGDWCIHNGVVKQAFEDVIPFANKYAKKIIATTDSSLKINGQTGRREDGIALSLPQPSPEFIKAYIETYNSGKPITKVLIHLECEQCSEYGYINDCRSSCNQKFMRLKLKDNQIIIKKIEEKMYSESEVIELIREAFNAGDRYGRADYVGDTSKEYNKDEWVKQNLK